MQKHTQVGHEVCVNCGIGVLPTTRDVYVRRHVSLDDQPYGSIYCLNVDGVQRVADVNAQATAYSDLSRDALYALAARAQ